MSAVENRTHNLYSAQRSEVDHKSAPDGCHLTPPKPSRILYFDSVDTDSYIAASSILLAADGSLSKTQSSSQLKGRSTISRQVDRRIHVERTPIESSIYRRDRRANLNSVGWIILENRHAVSDRTVCQSNAVKASGYE